MKRAPQPAIGRADNVVRADFRRRRREAIAPPKRALHPEHLAILALVVAAYVIAALALF